MDLKKRLKKEAGYVGRGAKLLPKLVAKKVVASGKAWWKEQQELGRIEREAYKKAMRGEARKRGTARAKARSKGQGGAFDADGIVEVLLGSKKDKD